MKYLLLVIILMTVMSQQEASASVKSGVRRVVLYPVRFIYWTWFGGPVTESVWLAWKWEETH